MNNLMLFAFEGHQVRCVGTADKPEWVAQDVCNVLSIKNARDALADFELDEKGVAIVYTLGGEQEMLTVTEPGLYRLVFKSRKPIAQRFRRWVFHEVIPSIRKTGSYSLQDAPTERMKLELELVRAKQHYQDTGYAISVSTSVATLQWLRGESPPPAKTGYRDRFLDPTGKEIGSSTGRSLTQLIADAGLNPKSTRDRNRVKKILKCLGFDYDKMQRWSTASYLREYPVLEDEAYDLVLKALLDEVFGGDSQPNLFVHSMQQAALRPGATTVRLKGEE